MSALRLIPKGSQTVAGGRRPPVRDRKPPRILKGCQSSSPSRGSFLASLRDARLNHRPTGGFRCAPTPGYFLRSLRDRAWPRISVYCEPRDCAHPWLGNCAHQELLDRGCKGRFACNFCRIPPHPRAQTPPAPGSNRRSKSNPCHICKQPKNDFRAR